MPEVVCAGMFASRGASRSARRRIAIVRIVASARGSAFSVSVGVERRHFEITLGSPKAFTKRGDSGTELTRHFCLDCGSPLYTSSPRHPDRVYAKAGAFDDPTLIEPAYQSWTRSSVPWGAVKAGLPAYETSRG